MFELFVIACLLVCPFIPHAAGLLPDRRPTAPRPGKHRMLSLQQASAVEAAVARVVTAGPEFAGHTLQLPCRECGRRSVPPVEYVDSPPIPFERAGLLPMGRYGFVVLATCTACDAPLISRVVDGEYAARFRALGVIDGEPIEADLRDWLATL